jgi:nitrile hydratase
MEPRHYLNATYYERMITGVAGLFVEKGVITREELERRAGGRFPLPAPPGPGQKARSESKNFQVGDRVVVTGEHIRAHARMPKYVRGKTGTVLHRTTHQFPFAGSAGHGAEAKLEPTYHVSFKARDLWSDADPNASVVVDLWESYLDHAPERSA